SRTHRGESPDSHLRQARGPLSDRARTAAAFAGASLPRRREQSSDVLTFPHVGRAHTVVAMPSYRVETFSDVAPRRSPGAIEEYAGVDLVPLTGRTNRWLWLAITLGIAIVSFGFAGHIWTRPPMSVVSVESS